MRDHALPAVAQTWPYLDEAPFTTEDSVSTIESGDISPVDRSAQPRFQSTSREVGDQPSMRKQFQALIESDENHRP